MNLTSINASIAFAKGTFMSAFAAAASPPSCKHVARLAAHGRPSRPSAGTSWADSKLTVHTDGLAESRKAHGPERATPASGAPSAPRTTGTSVYRPFETRLYQASTSTLVMGSAPNVRNLRGMLGRCVIVTDEASVNQSPCSDASTSASPAAGCAAARRSQSACTRDMSPVEELAISRRSSAFSCTTVKATLGTGTVALGGPTLGSAHARTEARTSENERGATAALAQAASARPHSSVAVRLMSSASNSSPAP
mmetsp:Transcript_1931/g.5125  ORF Transcript_1931/g.5125 Transcript_1931/m.5125 type:complete len:253 (-) Transcript_1931:7-765(-)